jgi:transcriptional regulator with XRE-family HTH domain
MQTQVMVRRHNLVREIRERRGLSQEQLAERLGVNQRTVSGFEAPTRDLRASTLRRLAGALDVPIAELVP